ncbi:MAG: hypothetical protein H0X29_03590 [Parachlamydiaceae bacterium]|nr:hypothetical protein [Parachlamydiaceae bacterium]
MLNLINIFSITCGVFMSALPLVAISITHDEFKENSYAKKTDEKDELAKRNPIYIFINRGEDLKNTDLPIKLTDNMIELLKLDDLYNENDTFSEVVKKTQKKWLAVVQGKAMQETADPKANTERNDLKDASKQIAIKQKVERVARAMGLFDNRNPILSNYKYGAWLGSYLQGVRNNLEELVKVWQNGCRFEKLVVFTGERYLRKENGQEDDIKMLCDPKQSPLPFKEGWKLPTNSKYETEYDMMRLVFDQVQLPKDMEEELLGKVEFVNAPKGQNVRAGTKDCYVTWLKTNPEAGTIVAASYPLLWVIQQIAGETILGEKYPLDTIAPALSKEDYEKYKHAVVIVHDTVTKCLYEINNQINANSMQSKVVPFPRVEG